MATDGAAALTPSDLEAILDDALDAVLDQPVDDAEYATAYAAGRFEGATAMHYRILDRATPDDHDPDPPA